MPVRLRMQRYGAKKRPYYRVVATDKRSPRDGRFIEMLGTYDPLHEPAQVRLNAQRVEYWLSVGAQPTDTVLSLIRRMRRGDVVDLSEEGADEAARKAQADQKREADEARRAKVAEQAKAAKAEAKKAEEEAKAAKEAEKAAKEAEKAEKAEAAAAEEASEEAGEADGASEEADESKEAEEASEKADESEQASDEEE